jgi:hypothetical protein
MDSEVIAAVFGLGGAMVGGAASYLGARTGANIARIKARQDAMQWQLDRKQNAYFSASRALLRVSNRRKRMDYPELQKEELPQYLDDLVEAQHGLSMVLTVCGEKQKDQLNEAIDVFDKLVDKLLLPPGHQGISLDEAVEEVQNVRDTVRAAQEADLTGS